MVEWEAGCRGQPCAGEAQQAGARALEVQTPWFDALSCRTLPRGRGRKA